MAETKSRVICVGEVMVELSRGTDARYGLSFGGDTFNTAVYLARAGVDTAYATALGDDPYSDALIALATAENVNRDLIARVPGRMPGLYLIETDNKGERKFFYWRDTSPARELFELDNWAILAEALLSAKLVYFSGITLSLYSNTGIGRFLAASSCRWPKWSSRSTPRRRGIRSMRPIWRHGSKVKARSRPHARGMRSQPKRSATAARSCRGRRARCISRPRRLHGGSEGVLL